MCFAVPVKVSSLGCDNYISIQVVDLLCLFIVCIDLVLSVEISVLFLEVDQIKEKKK